MNQIFEPDQAEDWRPQNSDPSASGEKRKPRATLDRVSHIYDATACAWFRKGRDERRSWNIGLTCLQGRVSVLVPTKLAHR